MKPSTRGKCIERCTGRSNNMRQEICFDKDGNIESAKKVGRCGPWKKGKKGGRK
jgi:hypothetical protein